MLPLVVLVAVASIQVMRIAEARLELQAAARDGARVAATTPDPPRAVASVMAALSPEDQGPSQDLGGAARPGGGPGPGDGAAASSVGSAVPGGHGSGSHGDCIDAHRAVRSDRGGMTILVIGWVAVIAVIGVAATSVGSLLAAREQAYTAAEAAALASAVATYPPAGTGSPVALAAEYARRNGARLVIVPMPGRHLDAPEDGDRDHGPGPSRFRSSAG